MSLDLNFYTINIQAYWAKLVVTTAILLDILLILELQEGGTTLHVIKNQQLEGLVYCILQYVMLCGFLLLPL